MLASRSRVGICQEAVAPLMNNVKKPWAIDGAIYHVTPTVETQNFASLQSLPMPVIITPIARP